MNGPSAFTLARERWAQANDFDLDPETWERLFGAYRAGTILECIKKMKDTKSSDPAQRFKRFQTLLDRASTREASRA